MHEPIPACTLHMLILQNLRRHELDGFRSPKPFQHASADVLRVEGGSLYPPSSACSPTGLTGEWGNTAEPRSKVLLPQEYRTCRSRRRQGEGPASALASGKCVRRRDGAHLSESS